ncbi:DUF6527 family protein [Streptomyces puniciscabiei]
MSSTRLSHTFADHFPDRLQPGVLYVSIPFATAAHLCCCGCGNEVVTPLSPTDWKLTFDGKTISLHPSIGNWNFPCHSHYWIQHNQIRWAPAVRWPSPSANSADDTRASAPSRLDADAQANRQDLFPRRLVQRLRSRLPRRLRP